MPLLTKIERYIYKAPFSIDAISLDLHAVEALHPNKTPFTGCLTRIDEASTRPPGGAQGHRVHIARAVAERALPSLEGMPIDFSSDLEDHNKKQVIGVIERGYIDGNNLMVEGYLLPKNWPEAVEEIRLNKHRLGMSYEIASVEVEDTEAHIWNLTNLVFTGAAVLFKNKAAYQSTSIAAQAEGDMMEKTVLDELRTLGAKIDGLQAAHEGTEEAAASEEEEAAASFDAEATTAMTAAQRARADADEEDAAHHESLAAAAHTKAFQARMKASAIHTALAASQRAAGNEEAATHHEAEATRLSAAADVAQQAAAALAAARAEAEAATDTEEGSSSDVDGMARLMAGMLRAMGTTEQAAADPLKRKAQPWDDDQMARMLAMCMKAMTFQPGTTMSKRAVRAAHDDETEDKALIRRMLQQDKGQSASTMQASRELMVVRRQLRDLQASNELITDTLKKLTGLLTDGSQPRGLATDGLGTRGAAPHRRSMSGAGGEQWVDKYAGVRNGQGDGKKTERQATDELIAAGVTDPRAQMAHILELQQAGLLQ